MEFDLFGCGEGEVLGGLVECGVAVYPVELVGEGLADWVE